MNNPKCKGQEAGQCWPVREVFSRQWAGTGNQLEAGDGDEGGSKNDSQVSGLRDSRCSQLRKGM